MFLNKEILAKQTIQGFAVYFEIARGSSTVVQFLLTPDGFNMDNDFVGARMYYRQLSSAQPRKQWQGYTLEKDTILKLLTDTDMSISLIPASEDFTENRLDKTIGNLIKRLHYDNNWRITYKPLVVEVSKKDLSDISSWKTPTKVIYRVQQVKKSVGFPETLSVGLI
jgi:hypothetical protein